MTKGFKRYFLIWFILFALIHITAWVMPLIRSKMFWTAYCIVTVAWLVQLLISYIALKQRKEIATPILTFSFIGLILLFIMDALGLYFFWPSWVLAISSCVFIGTNWIVLSLVGQSSSRTIERDEHIDRKTETMNDLIKSVKTLYNNTDNQDVYRLYEALKYSDKSSKDPALEEQIKEEVLNLKSIQASNEIKIKVDQIIELINQRG